jgi:hypothetical protein
VGALAAGGEALAVAQAAVAAEVHEALDVQRDLAAQIALDLQLHLLDHLADAAGLVVVEIVAALVQRDAGRGEDLPRLAPAHANR